MNMYVAAMPANLLGRKPFQPGRETAFVGGLTLAAGRAHEFSGPSRRTLALMLAGYLAGPVLWICPAWRKTRLNADGILAHFNPGRLLMVSPPREQDVLWSMEEALRSGAVSLVVADLAELPALVPVRRLHLAAESGAGDGIAATGVILTAGEGGAQGIESRWHMSPRHSFDTVRWRLARRHARGAPPMAWNLIKQKSRLHLAAATAPSRETWPDTLKVWNNPGQQTPGETGDVLRFPASQPARQRLARVTDLGD